MKLQKTIYVYSLLITILSQQPIAFTVKIGVKILGKENNDSNQAPVKCDFFSDCFKEASYVADATSLNKLPPRPSSCDNSSILKCFCLKTPCICVEIKRSLFVPEINEGLSRPGQTLPSNNDMPTIYEKDELSDFSPVKNVVKEIENLSHNQSEAPVKFDFFTDCFKDPADVDYAVSLTKLPIRCRSVPYPNKFVVKCFCSKTPCICAEITRSPSLSCINACISNAGQTLQSNNDIPTIYEKDELSDFSQVKYVVKEIENLSHNQSEAPVKFDFLSDCVKEAADAPSLNKLPPRPSSCDYKSGEKCFCSKTPCVCAEITRSPSLSCINALISNAGPTLPSSNDMPAIYEKGVVSDFSPLQNVVTPIESLSHNESEITKILFICPCLHEFESVRNRLVNARTLKLDNVSKHYDAIMSSSKVEEYMAFRVNNIDIILFHAGKYCTTAAIKTCNILARENITYALLFGLCGSINKDIKIGDICLPSEFRTHERGRHYDLERRHREKGNHFNNFYLEKCITYSANKQIIKLIKDMYFDSLSIDSFATLGNSLFFESEKRHIMADVRCSTGSAFVHNKALATFIKNELDADIIDMESYGVAEACALADVPFNAIRVPSDMAGIDGVDHIKRVGRLIALYNLGSVALKITQALINENSNTVSSNGSNVATTKNVVIFSKKL